jgi:hypothetical protein
MNITYNVIANQLIPYLSERNRSLKTDKEFDMILLLPDTISDINTDYIYFSELSAVLRSPCASMCNLFIICIDDRNIKNIPESIKCNFILVSSDFSQANVFNAALSLFIKMNNWEKNMERAIADKASLQILLNMSEKFLRKPLFIFDYALHTLACTKNIPTSSSIVKEIIANEGLPQNYIKFIADNNIFLKIEKYQEVGLYRHPDISPFNVLLKSMNANLLNVDCVVMFYDSELPTRSDIDYMRYFTRMLDHYINTNYFNHITPFKHEQSFFIDCIEENVSSINEMQRRSLLVGIPYRGKYSLSCVHFDNFSYASATYIIEEMKSANPYAILFIYKQEIILINDEQKFLNSEADTKTIEMRRDNFLKSQNTKVGISGICNDLFNLRIAYIQASAAIEIGMIFKPQKFRYRYRDYFFYHVIYCASKCIDLKYLYAPRLNKLIKYDSLHRTDNMKLLEVYITHDRNVTQTAAIMHLHRNSVLYRLDKIKTLLGESLDNPLFKANLLLSFITLQLIDALNKGGVTCDSGSSSFAGSQDFKNCIHIRPDSTKVPADFHHPNQ